MKHNLRMAFLSLLLVLTLGVMPVFAESTTDTDDGYESTLWGKTSVSQYRTDIRDAAVFGYDLYYISGHYLMRVDDCLSYANPVLDLNEIIQSETLRSIGYYDEVSVIVADYRLVLFSGNEGLLYFLKSDGADGFVLNDVSKPLDYASAWGVKWKEFPIAPGLYDAQYEDAFYDEETRALFVLVRKDDSPLVVRFDLETGKGEWVEVAESENAETYGYLFADGVLNVIRVEDDGSETTFFYADQWLFGVNLEKGVYTDDDLNLSTKFTLEPIKDYDLTLGDYVTHSDYRGYVVDADPDHECLYFVHDNTVWCLDADTEEVTGIAKLPFFAEDVRKGLVWDDCYLLVTDGGLYTIPLPDAYWMDDYLDLLVESIAE